MKKIITTVLASLVLFTGTAFAVEPEDIFLNYGGEIEQGDMMASVSLGTPWAMFDAINKGGWAAPSILGKFEFAQPIGPVPFTFGGYLGLDFRGTLDGRYGWVDEWGNYHPNDYYYDTTVYSHVILRMGGLAAYHICIPAVEKLDLNVALKMGMNMDFSNWYSNGVHIGFDFGMNLGASYFFTDDIGITTELGFPYWTVGAVFKF